MKRLLSCLFITIVVLTVQAQGVHLKFMGIPLDGKSVHLTKNYRRRASRLTSLREKDLMGLISTMVFLQVKEHRFL